MSNTAAKPKPKVVCGLQGCTKDYTKTYMKVHQKNVHKVNTDNIADAMNDTIEDNSDEAIRGGTQTLLNVIEEEEINEALEAEDSVFDKVEYILEGDRHLVSMVSHMVTPQLMEKQVVSSIIDIIMHSVEKEANGNVNKHDKEKSNCLECEKYKQVEQHKEAKITKIDNEKKALGEKLKAMTGQKRFFLNKSRDLETQLKEAKQKNVEIEKRLSNLEVERPRDEDTSSIRFTATVPVVAQATATNSSISQTEKYKCRKCDAERESIESLSDHMKAEHPNIQRKCKKCPEKFAFKSTMRNHMHVSHPKTVYPCVICHTVFLTNTGLLGHRSQRCKTPRVASPLVAPQVAAPSTAQAAPQVDAPQVVAPNLAAPLVVAPQFAAPSAPQFAAPVVGPQFVAPQSVAPQSVAPQSVAPQFVAPQFAASQVAPQVASQVAGPQAAAPQRQAGSNGTVHQWLQRLKCQKCEYVTNTQNELVYHIEERHKESRFKCDNCPEQLGSNEELVDHIVQKHTSQGLGTNMNNDVNRVRNTIDNVLWDCQYCGARMRSNNERDSHVCNDHPFQSIGQQNRRRANSQTPCTRGDQCHFYRLGKCHFSHVQSVERQAQPDRNSRNTRRDMWCSYQDKCNRRQTCVYKHWDTERDFIQSVLRQTQV